MKTNLSPSVSNIQHWISHITKFQEIPYCFISAPFADDFCLITGNRKTHQRLISKIVDQTKSMGLKLKPSKCRSLSLSRGYPTEIPFSLDGNIIPTVKDESHKFLGAQITYNNRDSEIFKYMYDKLSKGLTNINESLIRNEYKLKVCADYLLPSLRFDLTVNDMCESHLKDLDRLLDRYLKKWSGLPHPGTLAFLHMPQGLNVHSISDIYKEGHLVAHISTRMKGDQQVNSCLDSRIARESNWTRKISHIVQNENTFNDIMALEPNLHAAKLSAKKSVRDQVADYWKSHVKTLTVQGRFLELLAEEETAYHWKSFIYNLPAGVCKFMINSLSDTLNTNVNLLRWGKKTTDKCKNCKNRETTAHVLSHCP